MCTGTVYEKNALAIVAEDLVVQDLDRGSLTDFDASLSIATDVVILIHPCEVLITLKYYSILHVLFNPVVLNQSIRSQPILGLNVNAVVVTFPYLVHYNIGIAADGIDAYLALNELTELDLGLVAPLHLNSMSVDVVEETAEDLRFGVDTLEVNTHQ